MHWPLPSTREGVRVGGIRYRRNMLFLGKEWGYTPGVSRFIKNISLSEGYLCCPIGNTKDNLLAIGVDVMECCGTEAKGKWLV